MRKTGPTRPAALALAVLLAVPLATAAQGSRTVKGQVLGPDGKTVEGAVVVLINRDTRTESSVVTDEEGRYRFNGVDGKVSYHVYAYKGDLKSKRKGVSSFSSKSELRINLKLEEKEDKEETAGNR